MAVNLYNVALRCAGEMCVLMREVGRGGGLMELLCGGYLAGGERVNDTGQIFR